MSVVFRTLLATLSALLSAAGVLLLGVYLLVSTEHGTRWILQQALLQAEGLTFETTQGTLATGLTFRNVAWQTADTGVRIGEVSIHADPACLWRATLCITRLAIADVQGRSKGSGDSAADAITPPAFLWPLRFEAHEVTLNQLSWHQGPDAPQPAFQLETLQLRAVAQGRQLHVHDVRAAWPDHLLRGEFRLRTHAEWVLNAAFTLDAVIPAAGRDWVRADRLQAQVNTRGPLHALGVEVDIIAAGQQASARGRLNLLSQRPSFSINVHIPAWQYADTVTRVSVQNVKVHVSGTPAEFDWQAASELEPLLLPDAPPVPAGTLGLRGRRTGPSLSGVQLTYRSRDGAHALQWTGELQTGEPPARASGHLRLQTDRVAHWSPTVPGELKLDTDISAQWEADAATVQLNNLKIAGALQGQPLSLATDLDIARQQNGWQVQLRPASGQFGPAGLTAQGGLYPMLSLAGTLQLPDLSALLGDARGRVNGTFALAGATSIPTVRWNATILQGGWGSYHADRVEAAGEFRTGPDAHIALKVHTATLGGLSEVFPVSETTLEVTGPVDALDLAIRAEGPQDAVALRARLSAQEQSLRIQLQDGQVRHQHTGEWALSRPARLHWHGTKKSLQFLDSLCLEGPAQACITADSTLPAAGDITSFQIHRLDETLWARHLPPGLAIRSRLQGEGSVRWTTQSPALDVLLQGEDGVLELAGQTDPAALQHPFESIELRGSADATASSSSLQLQSSTLGRVEAALNLLHGADALDGKLRIAALQLAPLRPLLPAAEDLAGQLDVALEISGTRTVPLLQGAVELSDAHLRGASLPFQVNDLRATANLAGESLQFRGAFNTREEAGQEKGLQTLSGTVQFDGDATWAASGPALNLRAQGKSLQTQIGGHSALELDAALVAEMTADLLDARAEARILKGTIRLPRQSADAVWLADDVVLIPSPPGKPAARPMPFATVRTALDLHLGEQLSFTGHGLEGWLTGNLQLSQLHTERPRARGAIEIRDGRYRAYGQRLHLRKGRLRFRGNLQDPTLDVEAIRPLQQVVAGMRVKGLASAPEVRLFSDPAMPEEEILSWLILGKPLGSGSAQDSRMVSSALLAYGLRSGESRSTRLAERLGIQQFELGASDTEGNAGLFASGYLSPRLFVRYGVSGAEAANSLTLRYRVLPRLFLEASSGLETAVDLLYSFTF